MELAHLLDGTDDRALADMLADTLRSEGRCTLNRFISNARDCSEVEQTAFTVWESCAMVSRSGFLYLIENDVDLTYCADCYQRIGLTDVADVFRDLNGNASTTSSFVCLHCTNIGSHIFPSEDDEAHDPKMNRPFHTSRSQSYL